MKSIKIICSWFDRTVPLKAIPWVVWLIILLVGYAISFQRGDQRAPVENPKNTISIVSYDEIGREIVFGTDPPVPRKKFFVTVPLPSSEDDVLLTEPLGGDENKYATSVVYCEQSECVERMINTLGCPLCHTIPGIEGAVGELGPRPHMKLDALKRIKDPRYKGNARTAREYVKESTLNPDVYIVFNEAQGEPYPGGVMPQDYSNKLSIRQLEVLVDFISNTQPEGN
jgi:hypothetical protein